MINNNETRNDFLASTGLFKSWPGPMPCFHMVDKRGDFLKISVNFSLALSRFLAMASYPSPNCLECEHTYDVTYDIRIP